VLCVDYQALNSGTINTRGPMPLIPKMLDTLRAARIFTELDLRNTYHFTQIKDGDEYKTRFGTRYGHFKYQVMPFSLTYALATFQSFIDDCLHPYIDDFTLCYLDDIHICWTNEKKHEDHVRKALQRLLEFSL